MGWGWGTRWGGAGPKIKRPVKKGKTTLVTKGGEEKKFKLKSIKGGRNNSILTV